MPTRDPRIDAYIAAAAPFARPLLTHFRAIVHQANGEIEEAMKWSMPFFVFRGTNICHMAAFKAHCAIGFWRREVRADLARTGASNEGAMGALGRIAEKADLPADRVLVASVRKSCELIASGAPRLAPGSRTPRPALPVPADLAKALRLDAKARRVFAAFSPSQRRDYIEWITEAKRPTTRAARIKTTLEWVREGKRRNWKYERR